MLGLSHRRVPPVHADRRTRVTRLPLVVGVAPALILLLLVLALSAPAMAAAAAAAGEPAVPFLTGRIVDEADLLPPDAEQAITAKLAQLEKDTGAQVAVLTVPTIGDTPIEDYGVKVGETWKLGRKGIDDGAILIVAKQEHAMRIEVGYGLEPKLPDVRCKRILDELVVPRFRSGDFAGGVQAGIDAIDKAVRGGDPLPPPKPSSPLGTGLTGVPQPMRIGMGVVFFFFMVPFVLGALFSDGCGGWFLSLFLTPFLVVFPAALFGPWGALVGLAWLVIFPIVRLLNGHGKIRPTIGGRGAGWGGWWGGGGLGGWGGGGFGGGGFGGGGGGFSGGGGSFGGGGASSSW